MPTKASTKTHTDDSLLDGVSVEPDETTSGSVSATDSAVVVPEGTVVAEVPMVTAADLDPRLQPVDNHPPVPICPHCGEEL